MLLLFSHISLNVTAAAAGSEPIEKRVLTKVDPLKYPGGLCPGNPVRQLDLPVPPPQDLGARLVRDQHEVSAMHAAQSVYLLADLESNKSGESYISSLREFFAAMPDGYSFYALLAEPKVGLKYAILKPADDRPWILAIAGTQSLLDWIMDLELGQSQLNELGRVLSLFTTCQYLDDGGRPLASHRWIVTGHSLGGGLAQAAGYEIQRRRMQNSLTPVRMEVVTFNAFGARDLIEKSQTYLPRIADFMNVINYFVEGDEVSRIGRHIGPAKKLEAGQELSVIERHAMETVVQAAEAGRTPVLSGLAAAGDTPPPERRVLRSLLGAGSVLSRLAFAGYDERREEQIVERLQADVDAVAALDMSDPVNQQIRNFTSRLVWSRVQAWDQPDPGPLRRVRLTELRRLQRRLTDLR